MTSRTALRLLICLCTAVSLTPTASWAAYANPNSILIGDRAAGMGGAFTALAADPSATPFYNPATTILQEGSHFSGTVSVYNKYENNIGNTGDLVGAPARLNKGFFRPVPASSGIILNYQKFAVGLSILNPDYEYFSGQLHTLAGTTSSLNSVDRSLWVGGTFSTRLTDVDSVGFSLYYTARNLTRTVNDRISTGGGTGAIINIEEKNLTSNNLVAIIGYHRQLPSHWAAGISYRPPSIMIAGEGTYYRSNTQTTPFSDAVTNQADIKAITKIPQKISVGIAHEDPLVNAASLDVQMYLPLSYHDFPDFETGSDDNRYKFVANLCAGYEHFFRHWVSVRGGAFTNLTTAEDVDPNSPYRQPDSVNMYGFSANLNVHPHEKTSFTFGGYYTSGTGISSQLSGNSIKVLQKSQQVFTMLIGTGFHF